MEEIQKKEYDDYMKEKFKRTKNEIEDYFIDLNFMPGCDDENEKKSFICISCKGFVLNPVNCNKCTMVVCSKDFEKYK